MATTVNCNFESVFTSINDAKLLSEVANSIRQQLIDAYDKRVKELMPQNNVNVVVDAEKKTAATKKTAAKATEKKATTKTKAAAKTAKTETATKKATKKAAAEKKAEKVEKRIEKIAEEVEQIALTDKKAVKALGFTWVDYSEKAFVLSSDKDTKAVYKALSKLGGRPNKALKGCGTGSWVFSKAKSEAEVKKALKGLYKAAKKSA